MTDEITCTMRPVYRVLGKSFLTLWAACLRKAKKELVAEYTHGRDENDNYIWDYRMMHRMVAVDEFEECASQEDVGGFFQAHFNIKKWHELKRTRAKEIFKAWKEATND